MWAEVMHVKFPFYNFLYFSNILSGCGFVLKSWEKSRYFSFAKIHRSIRYHIYVRNTLGLKVTERGTWLLEC